jgi:hypothetical protein
MHIAKIIVALVAVLPAQATAASLTRYSCKMERSLGPVSSTSGATVPINRVRDSAIQTFFYDASTNKAETFDALGERVSLSVVKLPDAVRFIEPGGTVTTIGAGGDAQRVTTIIQGGVVATSIGLGRCDVEQIRMNGPTFG